VSRRKQRQDNLLLPVDDDYCLLTKRTTYGTVEVYLGNPTLGKRYKDMAKDLGYRSLSELVRELLENLDKLTFDGKTHKLPKSQTDN